MIERGGAQADDNLAGGGQRRRHLGEGQLVDGGKLDGAHGTVRLKNEIVEGLRGRRVEKQGKKSSTMRLRD
jgi:hypothetical protein